MHLASLVVHRSSIATSLANTGSSQARSFLQIAGSILDIFPGMVIGRTPGPREAPVLTALPTISLVIEVHATDEKLQEERESNRLDVTGGLSCGKGSS